MNKAMRFLLGASLLGVAHGGACTFLPDMSPVEHSLTSMATASLKFEGFDNPIVTRKASTDGETKIRIVRSSEVPSITVESSEVIISTTSCSSDGNMTTDGISDGAHHAASLSSLALLGALAMGSTGSSTSSLLGAGLGMLAVAGVAKADCSPSIEVEILTPGGGMYPHGAYEGVVDHLYTPPDHCAAGGTAQVRGECPEPFPQFTVSSETSPTCALAVIGGGSSGLYTALRLVDTQTMPASDICVFELTDRVGGRLVSLRGLGPNHDLSVDAGGYRTWPQFTPVLHSLITEYLSIPMGCYEVGIPESTCTRFNIVDEDGKKDGFATFVEEMMRRLSAAGVRWFPLHKLESISQDVMKGPSTLHFANGVEATVTGHVVLNVPQRPQLEIIRKSSLPAGVVTPTTWNAMHSVQTEIATKLYLYYSKAWWRQLGLTTGDFQLNGDAIDMPVQGRYHDGHVECDENGDCHGFLLCTYIHDYSGENSMYFRRYQSDRDAPVTIISDMTMEGSLFLQHAHERLMEYHRYHLPAEVTANIPPFQVGQVLDDTVPPLFAVMSNWNIATPGAGGAWHGWTDLDMVEAARFPLGQTGIFVINEAFSLLQGWAEGALKNADAVLQEHFSVSPPWSFVASDIVQRLAQTNPRIDPDECEGIVGGGGGGNSSGGGGSSGGSADEDDILCFTGDARLQLANGSIVKLAEAAIGMVVSDGTGKSGSITEVLVHEVKRTVTVAVLQTTLGELVAQPAHPIFVAGVWMELKDAHAAGHLKEVVFEQRYVDAFYNLEVDGNDVSVASEETGVHHAYVVNGLIASGLGDNKELNSRYPRQHMWKDATTNQLVV